MSQRLNNLKDQLSVSNNTNVNPLEQSPNDIVIVQAYRTAIAKGFKGSLKDCNTDYILHQFLIQFVAKLPDNLKKQLNLVEEISCGNVLNMGAGATEHRAACLAAGFPYQTSFVALNRQCSSGLTAINDIANKIKTGQINIGLALGVESMTQNYKNINALGSISDELKQNKQANKCLIPMGITNENVANKWALERQTQDKFALESYQKAWNAQENGLFKDEILPIELPNGKMFSKDEGPRPNVTLQDLSKIRPAFIKDKGTTTAGNSSQISDGASGVLLTRRCIAQNLNLPIIGKYIDFQVTGVPPEIMGVGPAYAIPKVLSHANLTLDQIDFFEINEAFAAQAYYVINKLKIPMNKVNPHGGAIALGHPLGCTGARQVATLLSYLKKDQVGVVSMCIGTGMGAAAIFVKE